MAASKFTRRELLDGIIKGAVAIPFALSPFGRLAYGQTSAPSNAPLRLINIALPFSPRTETNDGSNRDDNFIRIMWDRIPENVRPYMRFFTNFSYNIEETYWHGMAGYSYLLTCNAISADRGSPSDFPRTVSMDYEIARLMGSHYAPYANMPAFAGDPILNANMPVMLMSHKPYWGEYTGSNEVYFPPTTGTGVFDGNTNFGCFMSYRPDGSVKNPLYPNTANAYSSIFGIQSNSGEVLPESGLEQVLRLIHNSDVANFISAKQIQETQQSHEKILNLQSRIQKHQDYLEALRQPSTGGSCSAPANWPGVNAAHNDLNSYNFESIKSIINCDLHRVINFAFTDTEATGMYTVDANGLNGTNIPGHSDIDIHNATHREVGGYDLNNARMKSIYEYFYGQVGTLLSDLQQMEEPLAPGSGQNVLDNSIIYLTGTTGFPGVHSANNMAVSIIGGGRRLENGSNLLPLFTQNGADDYSAHVFDGEGAYENSSVANYGYHDKIANLQLSILRLFGSNRTSWGTAGGRMYSDARSNGDSDLINFSTPGNFRQYRV